MARKIRKDITGPGVEKRLSGKALCPTEIEPGISSQANSGDSWTLPQAGSRTTLPVYCGLSF